MDLIDFIRSDKDLRLSLAKFLFAIMLRLFRAHCSARISSLLFHAILTVLHGGEGGAVVAGVREVAIPRLAANLRNGEALLSFNLAKR